jgi:hypothetical protein
VIVARLGPPLGRVLHRFPVQVVERDVDGRGHVARLGESDQWPVSRVDGDFRLVALFFHAEDYFGCKFVVQNLADFRDADFHFFADGGGDFALPAGVLHIHERPPGCRFDQGNIGTCTPACQF